jgi:riboflavin biosynthesis pyrimidine reductase
MSVDRIPLRIAATSRAADPAAALVLTAGRAAPTGYALVRHAGAAAAAQHGACPCCRVPSGLATVLRQLFLERVRGEVDFARVVVDAPATLVSEAMADPLVAARYEIQSLVQ